MGVIMGWVIAFANLSGKTDLYLTCIARQPGGHRRNGVCHVPADG